jgi:hypothetical protein
MHSVELGSVWDRRLDARAFCTFRDTTKFPSDAEDLDHRTFHFITLYQVTLTDGGGECWLLLDQVGEAWEEIAVYERPFAWSEGARPPMSAVMDLVYARFGLDT